MHLKDDGANIIRVGSRSKLEELEGVNLRAVAYTANRTRAEKKSLWELTTSLDECSSLMLKSIKELSSCQSLPTLRKYLAEFHSQHHDALFGKVDEDG